MMQGYPVRAKCECHECTQARAQERGLNLQSQGYYNQFANLNAGCQQAQNDIAQRARQYNQSAPNYTHFGDK